MKRRLTTAIGLVLLLGAGCRTGSNYPDPRAPRYAGGRAALEAADTLHIVTFNIEYALRVDSAIALLTGDSLLARAQVLLLQEMDAPSTARVAEALGMAYVYYPAIVKFRYGRDVGNAVLSRFPIVEDDKLILPYRSAFVRTQRTATAATLLINGLPVRVYSAHLGTVFNVTPRQRARQLRHLLDDAARYDRVILGGDFNDGEVGNTARARGFVWVTQHGPRTARVGRLDHVLLRGFPGMAAARTATVIENRASSDHRPVWVGLPLR